MRTRVPHVLALILTACCLLAGSPQAHSGKSKKKTIRPPQAPPVSAAAKAAALERVDHYLTESGESPIEQPEALFPFFDQLLRTSADNAAPVHIIHYGDSHTAADDWTGGLRDLFR